MASELRTSLCISKSLSLPLTAVTGTHALLAVRGAGKTNAARVIAEEMFHAGLPFVAIDPVGSWYGLRSGRDGKPDGGLPVFIFGGKHGDVPLTKGSGELVADIIVEQRLACVVDLSEFDSEADKKSFLLAFAKRLFKKNTDPLHLFLEEADDYIPQRPMRDELHLKRAFENIVRRGRSRGLGMTIITQRSAVVNKDVLTQVETLFVMRTTGPQDIKAIEGWTQYHSVDDSMLESLAALEDGEAWVWSPHFLKKFDRFKFRLSTTFDSGATPKNVRGKDARRIATLVDVDVAKLRTKLADTLEKAQDENPAALRARVAKLKADLHSAQVEVERFRTRQPAKAVDLTRLGKFIDTLGQAAERTEKTVLELKKLVTPAQPSSLSLVLDAAAKAGTFVPMGAADTVPRTPPGGKVKLDACPRALLNVLVQTRPKPVTASYVSLASGYSIKSSGFANGLSTLRTAGLIEGSRDALIATSAGVAAMPHVSTLPIGRALLEYWLQKVDATPRAQLQVIYDAYPREVTKEYIAEHSGRSVTSSGFANGLSTLRSLGLIAGYKDSIKASDELFQE